MYYVYKIQNIINNKIYIGQTNKPAWRFKQHVYRSKNNPNQLICRALAKYGENNFDFSIIFFSDFRETVNEAEEFFINHFNSKDLTVGYNIANGGSVGKMSDYLRNKISEGLFTYYKTHSSPMKGKKFSILHKEKLSKAAMGKKGTNIGKKFSEEHKKKISQSLKGKKKNIINKPVYVYKTPHNKKITDEQAMEIRKLANMYSRKQLAEMFCSSVATISDILSNKTHRQVLSSDEPFKRIRKKLSKEEAKQIKEMLANNCTKEEIINKFGITKLALREIINGRSFVNV